jgi:hypothetical protein
MNNKLDAETLRIPAYMRKKMIVSQAKQKLILTALDRKEAGLKHDSTKPLAPAKKSISSTPRRIGRTTSGGDMSANRFLAPVSAAGSEPSGQLSFGMESSGLRSGSFAKVGEITHYLDKISVAIIMLSAPLKIGETVLIEGDDEIFFQPVEEMQIDRKPVKKAKTGSHIGLKVDAPAAISGKVYKMSF